MTAPDTLIPERLDVTAEPTTVLPEIREPLIVKSSTSVTSPRVTVATLNVLYAEHSTVEPDDTPPFNIVTTEPSLAVKLVPSVCLSPFTYTSIYPGS